MSSNRQSFRETLAASGGLPLLFEVMPPREDASEESVQAWSERISRTLSDLPLSAINIPEVRDESREGERTYRYVSRMPPRAFAKKLRAYLQSSVELVINRVVVYRTPPEQKEWFLESYRDWEIEHFVLVGGESHQVTYPGPSVTQAAHLIKEEVNPFLPEEKPILCGGIAIPTRRRADPQSDEPARLIKKGEAGINFFTTQVLYEAENICRLLADYHHLCLEQDVRPRRLFLSLAPIGDAKHIEFMRWLGIVVPPSVEAALLKDREQVGQASLAICEKIAEDVVSYLKEEQISVPLGFNISPLTRGNMKLGRKLVQRLAKIAI